MVIKNEHSGAICTVTEQQWKQMQSKGYSGYFTVVSTTSPTTASVKKNKESQTTQTNTQPND